MGLQLRISGACACVCCSAHLSWAVIKLAADAVCEWVFLDWVEARVEC